jgi:hypothetical protein
MTKGIVKITQKVGEQFIKNMNLPICMNCAFYEKQHKTAVCQKFGEKNIITGNIKYINVLECRSDTNYCGESGTYYIKHYTFSH